MKPNFALSLSFEGIKLLHRAAGGWREVGEVPVTSEDLGGELAMLRKTAASLEPSGVRTKLLIPASQIKYLTIDTVGLSESARRKAAEAALHDATPYEVAELAYDISMDGAKTHVAAVARETLAEAEAFANEHRFHPVSFVAVPDDAPYLGEPFFGTTKGAAALLEPEETVEADGIAVVIVGSIAPEAEPEAAVEVAPEVSSTQIPDDAPADTKIDAPQTAKTPKADKPTAKETSQEPVKATEVAEAKPADVAVPDPEAPSKPAKPLASEPVVASKPVVESAPATPETFKPAPKIQPQAIPKQIDASQPELSLEPVAASKSLVEPEKVSPAELKPTVPSVAATPAQTDAASPDKPAAPKDPVAPEVARPTQAAEVNSAPPEDTKRAALLAAASATGAAPEAPKPLPFKAAPRAEDVPAAPATAPASGFATRRTPAPATPAPKPVGGAQRISVQTPKPAISPLAKTAEVAATVGSAAAPVAAAARSIGGFLSKRKPRKGAAAPIPAPKAAIPATGSEAERMTVFGARTSEVGGKPRFLGLIMTVILLVFLAGVAAWTAVFLDDGIAGLMQKDKTRATASAPENQIDPEVIRTPDGIDPAQTDTAADVQVAALDPVLSAEETTAVDAALDPRPEPQVPVITESEAAARYAVTGIWPLAPNTPLSDPDTIDAPVFRSGIDPDTSASDALALPSPQEIDNGVQLAAAAASPPPFGQRSDVANSGLLVPTAEGVIAPGGFTLFAASPPLKPPVTLARFAAQPTVTAPEATSALAALRPQNRPLGLAEKTERAQLGGVSRGELAAFRPSLRPRSLQERAKEADEAAKKATEQEEARTAAAAQSAATAAQSAAAAAAASLLVPTTAAAIAPAPIVATRLATAKSIRPDTRPRNFSRIVNRAQRAAPKTETRVAAAASVAPRTVKPSVPSKASVARSATVKNAINLRKVNLIGIYGKPSSRHALVRLGNGRYKKVKVGDRIDGGRVGAISNSELRYSKSGRNVILKMP